MDEVDDELSKQRRKKNPPPPADPQVLAERFLKFGAATAARSARHEEMQARAWLQIAAALTKIAEVIDRTAPAPAPARRRR